MSSAAMKVNRAPARNNKAPQQLNSLRDYVGARSHVHQTVYTGLDCSFYYV